MTWLRANRVRPTDLAAPEPAVAWRDGQEGEPGSTVPAAVPDSLPAASSAAPGRSRLGRVGQPEQQAGHPSPHSLDALSASLGLEHACSSCSLSEGGAGATQMRIHCCTFNMAGRLPASLSNALLGGSPGTHSDGTAVDLYAFATQACRPPHKQRRDASVRPQQTRRALCRHTYAAHGCGCVSASRLQETGSIVDWERLLAGALRPAGYERLAWQTLRSIHLVLFAAPRFSRQVTAVRGSAVATGIGNLLGNKGAVALAVQMRGGFRLLLVGSHLAAHGDQVERRNADFARIQAGLFAPSLSTSSSAGSLQALAGSPSDTPRAAGGQARSTLGGWDSSPGASLRAPAPPLCSAELPHRSAGGEQDSLPRAQGEALSRQLRELRSASCPPGSARPLLPGARVEAGVGTAPIDGAAGPAGPDSSAGTAGPGAVEELRSSLGLLKSFIARRPSASLLASGLCDGGGVGAWPHVTLWAGDLNYRINGNSRAVAALLRSRLHEVLHANDQLRLQQRKGRAFQGFQEGRLSFPPTFKYEPGGSRFSSARVPAWTDRVLWKVQQPEPDAAGPGSVAVSLAFYTSVPEETCSDHKPVVAGFDLSLAGDAAATDPPVPPPAPLSRWPRGLGGCVVM